MKRRIRKIVNFFAFNLLFFALYLNFIHKDRTSNDIAPAAVVSGSTSNVAAYTGTVLVQTPEKKSMRKEEDEPAKSNQQ